MARASAGRGPGRRPRRPRPRGRPGRRTGSPASPPRRARCRGVRRPRPRPGQHASHRGPEQAGGEDVVGAAVQRAERDDVRPAALGARDQAGAQRGHPRRERHRVRGPALQLRERRLRTGPRRAATGAGRPPLPRLQRAAEREVLVGVAAGLDRGERVRGRPIGGTCDPEAVRPSIPACTAVVSRWRKRWLMTRATPSAPDAGIPGQPARTGLCSQHLRVRGG